jgi:hypothetical protein
MDIEEELKAKDRKYSSDYYYRHQEEVRKRRIVALMQKGHTPKVSTLQKYQLQATA